VPPKLNTVTETSMHRAANDKSGYNRFLLLVAGLGGLLYGIDVGIIAGALPYMEATSGLNAGQLSIITAAFFLPETKGRTLEEIGGFFEGKKKR